MVEELHGLFRHITYINRRYTNCDIKLNFVLNAIPTLPGLTGFFGATAGSAEAIKNKVK